MHCVYFARHGETVWNVENKICGMTDSPLTEKGRAQAAQLGEALADEEVAVAVQEVQRVLARSLRQQRAAARLETAGLGQCVIANPDLEQVAQQKNGVGRRVGKVAGQGLHGGFVAWIEVQIR